MSDEFGKPEMDEETANLLMALDSFWMAWKSAFGEGHKKKCFDDYMQIRTCLQKPQVTEKWIGKKAIKLQEATVFLETESNRLKFSISWEKAKDFICSLVEAIPVKKPTVPKGFVEKWGRKLNPHRINDFEQMLKEAGVEER